jgi:hypothetical protein
MYEAVVQRRHNPLLLLSQMRPIALFACTGQGVLQSWTRLSLGSPVIALVFHATSSHCYSNNSSNNNDNNNNINIIIIFQLL